MLPKTIPKEEQENFLSVYWQMLVEIESRTDPKKNILDKFMVEGAYNLLTRIGIQNRGPWWSKNNG